MQGFCIYKKYILAATYMIRLTLAYILYSLLILCMYKKTQRLFKLASFIGFLQFVRIVYFFCMYKKHLFQVSSCFQFGLCASFVQLTHFSYICRSLIYIYCTFIIIKIFDLLNLCIQNMYKFSVLYNFCTHFVYFVYRFFGKDCLEKGKLK